MKNISQELLTTTESMEIIIMLVGMFILGFLLGNFMKKSGVKESGSTQEEIVKEKQRNKESKKEDDFKLIEGIGPAIEKLLHQNGVTSFKDIVKQDVEGLEIILLEGGKKFSAHNPSTWPDQADLAASRKWRELEEYQEILNAGKKTKQKKQS